MFASKTAGRKIAILCVFALALLFGPIFAAGAQAETWRLPRQGVPAFVVDAPAGWTGGYDQYDNLQFTALDHSSAVQFSIIAGQDAATTPAEDIAAGIFRTAGAPPYERSESGSIAGRAGTAFVGTLPEKSGNLDLRVVLVKVDSMHFFCLTTLTAPQITADQRAAMEALIAGASIDEK
ncbi:MAG: hypothetical protein KGJ78_14085 [Alphaproteobacteria bacterium]|nr:hypothetical protein [Alphaproteobacteria bacterium]